jgi:hypothetical protein
MHRFVFTGAATTAGKPVDKCWPVGINRDVLKQDHFWYKMSAVFTWVSWVVSSGNIVAGMHAHVRVEFTGPVFWPPACMK